MNNSSVDIKEIYVDIAVSPAKNITKKGKVSNINHSNIKMTEQHPLDKLCRLLCIEEDETVEKRYKLVLRLFYYYISYRCHQHIHSGESCFKKH